MSLTRRITGAGAATALALTGLGLLAAPASATTPTGGCWVYSVNPGSAIESAPASHISSSLAAWTDPALAPDAGNPADYVLTTSGGTTVGSTRNVSMTVNKGPKSQTPASGTVYYFFSANGVNLPPMSQPFTAAAGQNIPGHTVTGSYAVGALGSNTLTFRKVIYDIPSFNVRVQCNGQTSGTAPSPNPATNPVDTNVVSAPFTATEGTIAVTKAATIKGKLIVGKTLKVKGLTTNPADTTVTYQWKRGSKNIKKATASKYKTTDKDEGKKVSVVITITRTGYTTLVQTVKAGKVKAED